MPVQKFNKGDVVIEEGSFGTSAFVINSGKVEVSSSVNGQKIVFATMNAKQIFGEMGLIEDKPRSATITALEETELREISRDEFNELFSKNPKVLLPIVKALFERLRTATRLATAKIASMTGVTTTEEDSTTPSISKDLVIDERYLVVTGATEFAKESLEYKELIVDKFPFKVGRYILDIKKTSNVLSDNDFLVKEDSPPYYFSQNHFLFDKIGDKIAIVDRGSRLGLIINDKKVEEAYILKNVVTEVVVGSTFSPFLYDIEIKGVIKRVKPDGTTEITLPDGTVIVKKPSEKFEEEKEIELAKTKKSFEKVN